MSQLKNIVFSAWAPHRHVLDTSQEDESKPILLARNLSDTPIIIKNKKFKNLTYIGTNFAKIALRNDSF